MLLGKDVFTPSGFADPQDVMFVTWICIAFLRDALLCYIERRSV